jgi:hypothetical protein
MEKKIEKLIKKKLCINHSDPNIPHLVAALKKYFKKKLKKAAK